MERKVFVKLLGAGVLGMGLVPSAFAVLEHHPDIVVNLVK